MTEKTTKCPFKPYHDKVLIKGTTKLSSIELTGDKVNNIYFEFEVIEIGDAVKYAKPGDKVTLDASMRNTIYAYTINYVDNPNSIKNKSESIRLENKESKKINLNPARKELIEEYFVINEYSIQGTWLK